MQLTLDLWKRERNLAVLAVEARSRGLLESDVALLVAIAGEDPSREADSFCCKSKRQWGKAIGRDGNTAVAAMRRLERLGVAACEISEAGHAVLVSWKSVFSLPLKTTLREAARERLATREIGGGEGVVRPGEAANTCSCTEPDLKHVASVSTVSARASCSPVVRPAELPAKPWAKRDGLDGRRLVEAVRERDERLLKWLYWSGVESGWWEDCEAFRVRYLACCYQAVASAKSSPMGLLTHLVRRNLCDRKEGDRDGWLTNEADEWAVETRRVWRRAAYERETREVEEAVT